MRIAVGADHGGFELKQELAEWLREAGHVLLDHGTFDANTVDYPDFARAVAEAVADGRADVGLCVDGAGIGSAMAANKVPGVRAANGFDVASAKNAREHNFANVLTLGGKRLTRQAAREIVEAFLTTPWGEERHARRIDKIDAIERQYSKAPAAHRPNDRGRTR
ncbi:MAG: RpiB/LacA/LacB family sugar-phosphate isomerase [Planctomycetes bacterium]|nr:RpiB/LacA/LacB family sugar-phosphate isomerase [Planctomycetota bacterium]